MPTTTKIKYGLSNILVSLHIPKTGGSSFLRSLEEYFGESLVEDYANSPINSPSIANKIDALKPRIDLLNMNVKGARCVHGHFLPIKYWVNMGGNDPMYITWVRDPVERMASHYHFWRRNYCPKGAPRLLTKIIEENWSFERFCLGPEMRNIYCQYLWRFPIKKFAFIGNLETYERDFQYFSDTFFDGKLRMYCENVNLERSSRWYVEDKQLRKRIESYHKKDMRIYGELLNQEKVNRRERR